MTHLTTRYVLDRLYPSMVHGSQLAAMWRVDQQTGQLHIFQRGLPGWLSIINSYTESYWVLQSRSCFSSQALLQPKPRSCWLQHVCYQFFGPWYIMLHHAIVTKALLMDFVTYVIVYAVYSFHRCGWSSLVCSEGFIQCCTTINSVQIYSNMISYCHTKIVVMYKYNPLS